MSLFKKKHKSEEEIMKDNVQFISWVQEFSKTIIFFTFIVFLISNLFILGYMTVTYMNGNEALGLETYITEVHTTFRDVVGGYLIKAAMENVFKIGGDQIKSYLMTKLPPMAMNHEDDGSEEGEDYAG